MERGIIIFALIAVIAGIILFFPSNHEVDLRIGVLKSVDTIHPYIAQHEGYFEEESLTYEIYSFGTSPALAEAIAAGEIDIAYMSVAPTATWVAKGTKMKILAGASRGGDVVCVRDLNSSGAIAISNKGTMSELMYDAFLKNITSDETIAISKKGTMTEAVYESIVRDMLPYEPIYGIEPADMPIALLVTKQVDAVLTWEPFASSIEEEGGYCILDVGDEWKKIYGEKYQRNVLVATESVLSNKTLVDKILNVHEKTIHFLNAPYSTDVVASIMQISPLKKKHVEYNSEINWESIDTIMRHSYEQDYLNRILSKDELVYSGD
jgi:NitT/TauT family transport system substrate-binding protein